MRKRTIKSLESDLQQLTSFDSPNAELEQYQTPPRLAAEILFIIDSYHDIESKVVLDLGCGTGILGLGCVRLGASKVVGVDIDSTAIEVAKFNAEEVGLTPEKISFIIKDVRKLTVEDIPLKCIDTVVMNPPFGTKRANTDYEFVQKALQCSNKVYSLHKSTTREFWRTKVNWNVKVLEKDIPFCIGRTMKFHKNKEQYIRIDLLCHGTEA